jgi:selenocysteine lyase/cysteine desulfurase
VATGRVVTNNAATTQPPRELLQLYRDLAPWYDNVHRGQSTASRRTTDLFESSYDTIAAWLNAPSRRNIAMFGNTTEAHNGVMYSLMTDFRDGDNVVTTLLEHNSNFVPWYGLANEILPRFGGRVQCRVARFDSRTGRLDLDHLASLVDSRTKLVCCTGASNFLGTKPDLAAVRSIAEGQVAPDRVAYNDLPWKYAAGTPNILGLIVSAQALRLLVDLVTPTARSHVGSAIPLPRHAIEQAMARIGQHTRDLTEVALSALGGIDGLTTYGPPAGADRAPLVAFTIAGISPFAIAEELGRQGIESRAGCHCATLAHRALGLDPPASCRLSFYLYNTSDEVYRAADAVARIATTRSAARGVPAAL